MIPYKDDNPTYSKPVITVMLIVMNVGIYLFFRLQGDMVYERSVYVFGMIPKEIFKGANLPISPGFSPYFSVLSSMFMHGGFFHLAGNMLYLWIFGNNVEDYFGHFRFIFFYLICGLVAAFAHLVSNPNSTVPTVGASGAIAGVLGAYFVLFPGARVYVLVPFFYYLTTMTLPAVLVLGFWFIFQLIYALPSLSFQGGVAYFAHIGGFVAGYVWARYRKRRKPPRGYGRYYYRRRNLSDW